VLVALCWPAAAFAQTPARPETPAATSSPERKPTKQVATLDTITVTARRHPERAQDVPVAMSFLSGDDIDKGGFPNLQDIYRKIPSLRVVDTNPRNVGITIRGIGANLASDMLVNSVGVFVDGVYYPRPGSAAFDLLDVKRVTVLRGPQGTLFGKNTTAGAIDINTWLPSFSPFGEVRTSLGSHGTRRFEAMVTGPLGHAWAGSLAASVNRRNGLVTNVDTGQGLNNLNDAAVRGQLLYDPGNGLTLRLVADYSKQNVRCCTDVIDKVVTTFDDGTPIVAPFFARAAALGYTPLPVDAFARHTDIDSRSFIHTEQHGVAATLDWQFGNGYKFTSISARRTWSYDPYTDLDMTALPIITQGAFFSHSHTTTQEFRLTSPSGRPVDYVLGLFYMNDNLTSNTVESFGSAAGPWILPALPPAISTLAFNGLYGGGEDQVHTRSEAAYGHMTWHINPRFDLGAGLRYTDERKSGFSYQGVLGAAVPLSSVPPALQPLVGLLRAATLPAFDTRTTPNYPQSNEENDLSGNLSATWKVRDNITTYATYSRGYKSGGINFGANVPASSTIIQPEKVNSYELGLKSQWLNQHLAMNVALYREDVDDYQSSRVFTSPLGAATIYVANVPKIRSQGGEFDLEYVSGHGLTLSASMAYTDATYISAPVNQCAGVNPAGVCDLTGRSLPNVSRWAAHLGADYVLPASFGHGSFHPYVGAGASYRSGFYSDASSQTWVPAFALFDFRAGLRSRKTGTDVALWVNNAFNKHYYLYRNWLIFNTGAIVARLGDPRIIGISIDQRF
jgi:iron complex outermembrane receptor protein